jgi:hypothetical protein
MRLHLRPTKGTDNGTYRLGRGVQHAVRGDGLPPLRQGRHRADGPGPLRDAPRALLPGERRHAVHVEGAADHGLWSRTYLGGVGLGTRGPDAAVHDQSGHERENNSGRGQRDRSQSPSCRGEAWTCLPHAWSLTGIADMNGLHRPILPRQRAHSEAAPTARRGSGLVRPPSRGRSGAIRCGGWLLGAGPHADDRFARGIDEVSKTHVAWMAGTPLCKGSARRFQGSLILSDTPTPIRRRHRRVRPTVHWHP